MIAKKADIPLEQGTHDQILEACSLAGTMGRITDWWKL